ncbi:MAG: putative sugar nucleotidyl transferase [Chitinophagaceae bacterium]
MKKESNNDVKQIPANVIPSHRWININKSDKIFTKTKSDPVKIEYPWHLFQNNDIAIREDFELVTRKKNHEKFLLLTK